MIAERNYLSRTVTKKVHGTLKDYPGIGKEIEMFVTDRTLELMHGEGLVFLPLMGIKK